MENGRQRREAGGIGGEGKGSGEGGAVLARGSEQASGKVAFKRMLKEVKGKV